MYFYLKLTKNRKLTTNTLKKRGTFNIKCHVFLYLRVKIYKFADIYFPLWHILPNFAVEFENFFPVIVLIIGEPTVTGSREACLYVSCFAEKNKS